MSTLTYFEAVVVGAVQGVSELFPVSSLGHAVLIPAMVGGSWARDLNVAAARSPYLAFIVGLHVATAAALVLFYWRDWVVLLRALGTSIRYRRMQTGPERLIWLLIVATIPVGIAGLVFDKLLRTTLGAPLPASLFLILNGGVLLAGHRLARRERAGVSGSSGRHVAVAETSAVIATDDSIASMSFPRGVAIGAAQVAALLPGISRSGVVMVAGQRSGLTNQEAARFSFLLATPVILAAGLLKLPDLFGPLGQGITLQVLAGSAAAFVTALLAVAFLDRYFARRSLVPFAIYCIVAGTVCLVVILIRG